MNASSGSGLWPRRISIARRTATSGAAPTLDARGRSRPERVDPGLPEARSTSSRRGDGRVSVTALARGAGGLARVGERDGEEARRAGAGRARALPRRRADPRRRAGRGRGDPPPPPARALPRARRSASTSTPCTTRRTGWSTSSRRSSRRGSTARSATRPTTRTATRSPTRTSSGPQLSLERPKNQRSSGLSSSSRRTAQLADAPVALETTHVVLERRVRRARARPRARSPGRRSRPRRGSSLRGAAG